MSYLVSRHLPSNFSKSKARGSERTVWQATVNQINQFSTFIKVKQKQVVLILNTSLNQITDTVLYISGEKSWVLNILFKLLRDFITVQFAKVMQVKIYRT